MPSVATRLSQPFSPLYFIPSLGNGSSSSGGGNATVIPPNPRLEDSLEALHMMGDNPIILLAIFSNMCVAQPHARLAAPTPSPEFKLS
jgi:hypothetical protein